MPESTDPAPPNAESSIIRRRELTTAGLVAGLILFAVGGLTALTYGIPQSIPVLSAGLGLVLFLFAVIRRRPRSDERLRRSAEYTSVILNASLLAGILVIVNVIAFRYGGRPFDLTRERTNSLASQTVNQLTSLTHPIRFTLFFGRGPRALAQRERIAQLLELYRTVNPAMIRVEGALDPFQTSDALKRAPDLAILQGGGVLIETGDGKQEQSVVVRNQDMFPIPPRSLDGGRRDDQFVYEFRGEDAITSALIRIRETSKSRVAFTIGHGEPSINDLDPRGDGLGIWKSRLAAVGCKVGELDLGRQEIPDDLELLVIVDPKSPFKSEEITKIEAFADRRGPLLLILGNSVKTGLEDLLHRHHLEIGGGAAADLRFNLNGSPRIVLAGPRPTDPHPITHPLGSRRVLVPEGAPLRILTQSDSRHPTPDPDLAAAPILQTGVESWAEMDASSQPKFEGGVDLPGPVVIGAAVGRVKQTPKTSDAPTSVEPRLVLFSSRVIAGNLVCEIENSNLDLVMNAASWLRNRPDAVGISPSTHIALQLKLDPALRVRLVVVPTVTAAIIILGIGIAVYLTRRE